MTRREALGMAAVVVAMAVAIAVGRWYSHQPDADAHVEAVLMPLVGILSFGAYRILSSPSR